MSSERSHVTVNALLGVASIVAINQAVFAFAPAIFGFIRDITADYAAAFLLAGVAQACAVAVVLVGRTAAKAERIAP